METLAKSVQQAQAAVLGVQDDLALLRAQLEEHDGATLEDAPAEATTPSANPYFVELQTSIQQKQEAAARLLQSSAHLFYAQFGALEERAARLDNVRQKEKELQSAKKSMQRYFDAHATELAEARDTHAGEMRLEVERRQHLEHCAVQLRTSQQQQQLAHHVLLTWMKKAMIRNLTREYVERQSTTRQTYQAVACDALVQQRCVVQQQRLLYTWRLRVQRRQQRRLKETAAESERRAQFFRQELATTQQTLRDRLGAALQERQHVNTDTTAAAPSLSTTLKAAPSPSPPQHTRDSSEDEVQRLRTALEEVTLEFSERTGTYIRQQEHLEQLFWAKEQKLREALVSLQADLSREQAAHAAHVAQQRTFVEQVNGYWTARQGEWQRVVQQKEEQMHYAVLGLVGRLRHRQRTLQDEAARLANEVYTLAPLSERCVRVENQLTLAQQLVQTAKEKGRAAEQRASADRVVAELLTDRVVREDSAALRRRYFSRWMQHRNRTAFAQAQEETQTTKASLLRQRQQALVQLQETAARHETQVAQLRNDAEQLRRTNVRLQAEVETLTRAQRERDGAYYASEAKNSDLSAALLREKMERRGAEDKWRYARLEGVVLAESHARCRLEAQESRWWAALQQRERSAVRVWTAALHYDAAQLTAVCEGWEAHCREVEAQHVAKRRADVARVAAALERAFLQSQTLARWAAWQAWTQRRRAVRNEVQRAAEQRRDLIDRHSSELARLHASHDAALRRQQQELAVEKTQLQGIHQERSEAQRCAHAQTQAQLVEQHQRQLTAVQASHAAVVQEQDEAMRELQGQTEHLGSLVVEYCAAATFTRWQMWARERQAQRTTRQRRGFFLRIQQWHTAALSTAEVALAEKASAFADVVVHATQAHHTAVHHYTQHLRQQQELHAAHLRKAERSAFVAEKEVAHLRGELQHVRLLYAAEQRTAEVAQNVAETEREGHRAAMTVWGRFEAWQEATHRLAWGQQRAVCNVFEEAATALLGDLAIDTQALHETYVDALHAHEATRKSLHRTAKEKAEVEEQHSAAVQRYQELETAHAASAKEVALLTDTLTALVQEHEAVRCELDGVRAEKEAAEASHAALAQEDDQIRSEMVALKAEAANMQDAFSAYVERHVRVREDAEVQTLTPPEPAHVPSSAPASPARSTSDDVLEVSALNVEDQQQHREGMEAALTEETRSATAVVVEKEAGRDSPGLPLPAAEHLHALETYTADTVDAPSPDDAAKNSLGALLQQSFLEFLLPTTEPTTAAACPTVLQALETVRRAALRWAAAQTRHHAGQVATLNTRRAQSEEALAQLRDNMEDLLDEQRSLAAELQHQQAEEDPQQQRRQSTQPEEQREDSPTKSSLVLQERLGALTSRYARVLDAFYTDITQRQDTFYSVNGMLIEVDQFSETLLQRFEENVLEMARLRGQLGSATPVSQALSMDLSVMSPEARHPPQQQQQQEGEGHSPFLARVLRETATPPQSPHIRASEGPTAAAAATTTMTSPSPPSSASSSSGSRGSSVTLDRRALRERVHLLERMLVEAKVQVAEASTMMTSASRRAASLTTAPSIQAQIWAAQAARDFAHLAVAEEEYLSLFIASEPAAEAVLEALRTAEARLGEAQSEMAQQLQTACVAVEASVQQRCHAELMRYEATVRSVNETLAEATRRHASEMQQGERMLEQQRAAAVAAAERHAREVQQVRQNYSAEVAELTEHIALVEEELRGARQATQAAVKDAVERQTELLTDEHAQTLRALEKKLMRLTAEKALMEERVAANEQESERRLQVERDAVARLQRRLADTDAETDATPSNVSVSVSVPLDHMGQWSESVSELYATHCTAKADCFAACVMEVLEQEREEWETELVHLRERVASLLEKVPPTPPAASCEQSVADAGHGVAVAAAENASSKQHHPTFLNDTTVDEDSSQALTLSPSPGRRVARASTSVCGTQSPVSPSRNAARQRSPPHSPSIQTARSLRRSEAVSSVNEAPLCSSAGISPTRCRSPSLDSLELSASLLRYSKMLSDQRTRNTERLTRANALTAEVEDLLLRGAELTHLAGAPKERR